ncbi:hypothetical protein R6Q59_026652 [Mikania micrantha]
MVVSMDSLQNNPTNDLEPTPNHVLPSPSSSSSSSLDFKTTHHHQHPLHVSNKTHHQDEQGFVFKNNLAHQDEGSQDFKKPPHQLQHGNESFMTTIKNVNTDYEVNKEPGSLSFSSVAAGEERVAVEDESGRERLMRHRVEMAGRVRIPDIWGHEDLLKDWIDCTVFDSSLGNNTIMSARAALVQERRSTIRIEN